MNKRTSEQLIAAELEKLNKVIDMKIIKGQPYRREAARHRALLARLRSVQRESSWSLAFSRLIYR